MVLQKLVPVAVTALIGTSTVAAGVAATSVASALPAAAASSYRVRVTCDVPRLQKERQLDRNSCLNYLKDGTQTYTAHVRNSSGNPVAGLSVTWTDSDAKDAFFRPKQTPCKTGTHGMCSAELVVSDPRAGEKITVTATVIGGYSGTGWLTFSSR